MSAHDQLQGAVTLLIVGAAFAYATIWLLGTPFADEGLYWLNLFPPAERLVNIVALTGAFAASVVVGFLGCILVHSQFSRLRR